MYSASAPTLERVKRGALVGLVLAALLAIAALLLLAVRGSALEERMGMTPLQLVACYILGGLAGGTIAGALAKVARNPWGLPLVGFLAVFPFALAVSFSMVDRSEWIPAGLVIAIVTSLLLGAGIGTVVGQQSNS